VRLIEGIYTGNYIGKSMCGFVHGHMYKVNIERTIYGYVLEEIEDFSDADSAGTALINYASEKSIQRNWKF